MSTSAPPPPTIIPANNAPSPASRILRSFSILLSSQLITWALTSVYIILSPRYLGPDNLGRMTVAYAFANIISMFIELGMIKLVIRELARDHDQAEPLINALLGWRVGIGLVAYGGLVLAVNWLDYPTEYRPFFYFVGLAMVFDLVGGSFNVLFQSLEQFKFSAWMDITNKAVALLLVGLIVLVQAPPWTIAAALAAGTFASFLQGWWWSRRYIKIRLKIKLATVRWLIWHSLPLWGTSVLLVVYTYIDSLLLSLLTNDTVVGWYAAPTRLFNTSMFLPVALGSAIFPALARLYDNDRPAMIKLASLSLRWLVTASLPIAVMVMALSPNFVVLLYGEKFRNSVPVMAVLGLTLFSTYISILANQFLVATHRQLAWTKVMLVATLLNPLINLVLINYFQQNGGNGAVGAAWSLFFTETLMLVPAFWLLPRAIFTRKLLGQALRIALACGPMAATVWWLNGYFFLVPALAGLIVFAASAFLLRAIPLDEVGEARRLLLKRG